MELNLIGRINNLDLAPSNALLPLYEAVVNAIQAIEDTKLIRGKIKIHIVRSDDGQNSLSLGDRELHHISGFKVTDNGIGFDENNFKSFETSDSRWKESRGCKGIGRLFWLKAFDSVKIESVFSDSKSGNFKRQINFDLIGGVSSSTPTESSTSNIETTISLIGFKDIYRVECRKKMLSIADKLIEHCLIYFLDPKCPQISISDDAEDTDMNLNSRFKDTYGDKIVKGSFTEKEEAFEVILVPVYSSEETASRLHWCANDREVYKESLSKIVPNLRGKIKDGDGRSFVYMGYLSGTYLNKHTNSERTSFSIPLEPLDSDEEILDFKSNVGLSISEIKNAAAKAINEVLKDQLDPIQSDKKQAIEKFVMEVRPEYRALVNYEPSTLDKIPPGLAEDKLELELHKAQYAFEAKLKKENKVFLDSIKDTTLNASQRKATEEEYFKKISVVNQSNLAKYVLGRKVVIELFDEFISKKDDGTFDRESAVHSLIFPMHKTSDQVKDEGHNLWLIDERLAYHYYLASDKKISELEPVEVDSKDRPDVIVFNNPSAYVEGDAPFSTVVIVEFKRPGRNDAAVENPIKQILGYIKNIRSGQVRDKNGQQIRVNENTPFFAYLVCDLTPSVEEAAEDASLICSPDELGYFGYNPNYNAYIEILSYKKISTDSKKRNRIFFNKLQL